MWSNDAFGNAPSASICEKVIKYIEYLKNPTSSDTNPVYTQPNTTFKFDNETSFENDLEKIINGKEMINTGWVQELQSFWVSTFKKLYIFHYKLSPCFSAEVERPVVAVSFISGLFVALHENSISLFTEELHPIQSTYTIPKGVSITSSYGKIIGCSDGYIREIILNPSKNHVTIKQSAGNSIDEIKKIIETRNYYVTLSKNSTISIFNRANLSRIHYFRLKNIINIWTVSDDIISAFDRTIILYTINLQSPKHPQVQPSHQLLASACSTQAIWSGGFLTVVDPNSSFDQLTTVRFHPTPSYTTTAQFGVIHLIAPLSFGVVALTSAGIIQIRAVNDFTRPDEDIWAFPVAVAPMWNVPIGQCCKSEEFVRTLQETKCDASKYVLQILDDVALMEKTQFASDFLGKLLNIYFSEERVVSYSRLRKVAFSVRLSMTEIDKSFAKSPICELISKADCGDSTSEHLALSSIEAASESGSVPAEFPILSDFLYRYRHFDLLIDALCNWANVLYPDSLAIDYENANFPQNSPDDTASFQLRLLVLRRLNPLINLAVRDEEAFESVMRAVKKHGITFQYYLASYLNVDMDEESCVKFDFQELSAHLQRLNSLYLPALLIKRGQILDAYLEFIRLAIEDIETISIDKRIELLDRAIKISPEGSDNLKAKQYLLAAEILHEYITNNSSLKRNFFAEEPKKLIQTLKDYGELSLAVQLSSALGTPRKDIVDQYTKNCTAKELAELLAKIRGVGCETLSEKAIAKSFFSQHDGVVAAKDMVENGVSPSIVFDLINECPNSVTLFANNIETLSVIIQNWTQILPIDRCKVSDLISKVIVEMDARGEGEKAEIARKWLPLCTLEESFTDIWDKI
ncbi:hypothetical protein TVAG_329540 [Trichomonas vaginalis G3]|uniref:Uncharacterized protein n=1 Tax=Trichomonas vaginalis (strain ATCC PRA-98 / G3) TaxID=412133 RepID=A2EBC2_TRIV3|nr:hypothetical protein TVAGG3_0309480 [Trichomonas vaginalis G3]EAY10067.1 hypothetical protein TVAG_329540 [Trichomonas vaginalis G3]KAI5528483.1 hypothetical protein TVAGG3_0309480 [Trichomonas vaginalis G3]|eukprot:XP_001322290.1 hypothetical protein [Trichomonas vaginalis G3]